MRLLVRLPSMQPNVLQEPQRCPYPGCKGKHCKQVQEVRKPLRDTRSQEVNASRYRCLCCGRPFWVSPSGVARDHCSPRVQGVAGAWYLFGLRYDAVSLVVEPLGLLMRTTLGYATVQEAARKVRGMSRQNVIEDVRASALGSEVTSVQVKGTRYPIGGAVDAVRG